MTEINTVKKSIFIIGAKCIGQYGGFETFIDKLTEVHSSNQSLQYYVATKANGEGAMDETKLKGVEIKEKDRNGIVRSFIYHNAIVVKLNVPKIGSAQAIAYDVIAFNWCLDYIKNKGIQNAVIYVLACRLGPFFRGLVKRAHTLNIQVVVNPDGHEWKRAKWIAPVRKYWKKSEKQMVKYADMLICDSVNIEKYIKTEYESYCPQTVYIAYGADLKKSELKDDDSKFTNWMKEKEINPNEYYLCCGRFVPENSFEIMIREFMKCKSHRDLVIITTKNDKYMNKLEKELEWSKDKRIKFVGTVYDSQLLKKIRENAYGYLHGHTVGGTNPSALEALCSTKLNLFIDVSFNREVAENTALYWNTNPGNLAELIDRVDKLNDKQRIELGNKGRERISNLYSWKFIGNKYEKIWTV